MRIDSLGILVRLGKVAQGLDAAGGGAGAQGDQVFALGAHFLDPFGFVGRGDRAFDDADVVRAGFDGPGGFQEIGNVHRRGQVEQFIFQVEQRKLAAVAGGKLVDSHFRLGLCFGCEGH